MPLALPSLLSSWLTRPVAIFGGGISGDAVQALLAALGTEGKIYDAKGAEFSASAAHRHALVVFSPGFAPDHPWLAQARAAGLECLGELDFAALFWRGTVIAITGTNGKTTLTEFLTHALAGIGRAAHATGNIGYSFSRLALETEGGSQADLAVCEVSSFQAETLKHFRADATLWTNFAEDHLERHPGLEAYFAAKWNLVVRTTVASPAGEQQTREQKEPPIARGVFVGSSVQRWAKKFERPLTGILPVETEGRPRDPRLDETVFAEYPQRENFILVQAWWIAAGLGEKELYAAARTFQLGRHRLTRAAEIGGVTYWNDSKATNFHAVEAALNRFQTPVVLIAGGKAKGGDLAGFIHRIGPRVHHVVLIGATAPELGFHCASFRVAHSFCGSLAEAVRRAAELAPRGGHVLLSPGFASFDQFRNYEDRGEQFEKLVRELETAPSTTARASATSLR